MMLGSPISGRLLPMLGLGYGEASMASDASVSTAHSATGLSASGTPDVERFEQARQGLAKILHEGRYHRWERRFPLEESPDTTDLPLLDAWGEILSTIFETFGDALVTLGGWIGITWQWFWGLLPSSSGSSRSHGSFSLPSLSSTLIWILLALLLALFFSLIIWQLLYARRRAFGSKPLLSRDRALAALDAGEALALDQTTWQSLSQELLGEGDVRRAIRAMYLALLAHAHQVGAIRFHTSRTNGYYARTFRGEATVRHDFQQATRDFDWIWYGHAQLPLSPQSLQAHFEQVRENLRHLLQTLQPSKPKSGGME